MKKQVKYISAGMLAGMLLCGGQMQAANTMSGMHVCVTDAIQKDNRPEVSKRLFRSNAVEKEIIRVQKLLKNEKLAWMFANCFPNTIDTTVHFRKGADGKPDGRTGAQSGGRAAAEPVYARGEAALAAAGGGIRMRGDPARDAGGDVLRRDGAARAAAV